MLILPVGCRIKYLLYSHRSCGMIQVVMWSKYLMTEGQVPILHVLWPMLMLRSCMGRWRGGCIWYIEMAYGQYRCHVPWLKLCSTHA